MSVAIDRLTLDAGTLPEADARRLPALVADALRGWQASGDRAHVDATVEAKPDEPVEALANRIARAVMEATNRELGA
jgi:hypothetical protein